MARGRNRRLLWKTCLKPTLDTGDHARLPLWLKVVSVKPEHDEIVVLAHRVRPRLDEARNALTELLQHRDALALAGSSLEFPGVERTPNAIARDNSSMPEMSTHVRTEGVKHAHSPISLSAVRDEVQPTRGHLANLSSL